MKATAIAPSNIAFIKYWGKKDEELKLPANGSISMNLSNLVTTTTVEFSPDFKEDLVTINGKENLKEAIRVIQFLNLVRQKANVFLKAKVISKNNFPDGTGLSSSASGFAALALASTKSIGLNLNKKELSSLARLGSGSACRSISDGFVEWEGERAKSIYPPDYWKIIDVVVIVSSEKKDISSTDGQKLASTSPFFQTRLNNLKDKIHRFKKALETKNFTNLGEIIESEALELHAIMLTSTPSLIYWCPETLKLMKLVKQWRSEGLDVYFTLNTGQDVHLIVEEKNKDKLIYRLKEIKEIKKSIVNRPAIGVRLTKDHLF
ncbi:diphosphomevalonate decarboxylase [Candidatus Roizmanbacteria bacterium CG_4_8_14_3_um_filter_34_9]|uniref:diphosphomevalonate decarboxylase n=3 Tax=Candidatus Roizmaniibacteriota TaxID=1752723 RepID=A0A2M7ATY9_9BACT|nr:MAG: diphosphomevalonate decarboxylase [Candidatus Roizmanbacteria bacterium CG07_land_8_20_14_0_80_34_15]PIU74068.1 MAG: diphosphomevalonate decarboxylase [Candidatus Roizmanbacteria bacterium CG06_land_8_20_14_3_00_34_14]PIW73213.1 MAG: diphosphomevalonate decarboxylase [Candidatus Roizmanbacteria bacterium CG_4_8_14_3_um_filter_34_9]